MKSIFLVCVFSLLLLTSCEKQKDHIIFMWPWIVYGSVTDREGYSYRTYSIGDQTWMIDNLKTTLLNDGTSIPVITDAANWNSMTGPACCWQNNDPARRVTYGVLYNWYVIGTGKLCPKGWHVPNEAEWNVLIDHLGGENTAGGKLKERGFKHWRSPNTGATDESAFSAYPGGQRKTGAVAMFQGLLESGTWWSSNATEGEIATSHALFYDNNGVQKYFYPVRYGLSVRCVMN